MQLPSDIHERIKKELESFCKTLPGEPKELYMPMQYMLALGGKNIRPALMLLTCKMLKGHVKQALPAAIAIELFHNFTLIHDDITDNSPLRRGKATVYKKWNLDIALLSGDALLIKSYQQLHKTPAAYLPQIFKVFNDAALKVCEGQQFDMNYETQKKVTLANYLNMISMKTAALFSASMEMGAILSGASAAECRNMQAVGENLGMLFQLQDDILDVFGKPDKTGKQSGGDIIQDKKTFLLLKAMELAKGKTKTELHSLLGNTKITPAKKVKSVKKIYHDLEVEKYATRQMEIHYKLAVSALSSIHAAEKKILLGLIDSLMKRDK